MNKTYLEEAFKSLNELTLNEDAFDISEQGLIDAENFMELDFDEVEDVIDVEAETEEELKDSYLGNVILDCNICHSKIYKKPEEVIIGEDEIANIEETCPYCQSNDGYVVIGQVAEYCDHCEDEEEHEEESEEEEPKEEPVEIEKTEEEIEESKKPLEEMSLYGLEPEHDSRASFYNKATVDINDETGEKTLYSYNTPVAKITKEKEVRLLPKWDSSATTLRHVKEFLKQNGLAADSLKQIRQDYLKESKIAKRPKGRKLVEMFEPIDSFKEFTFIDKTKQGFEIKKVYRDLRDNRMHIIAYRPKMNDFLIGLGYSPEDGTWNQGRYDFKSLEDAIKSLKADYKVEEYSHKNESCSSAKAVKESSTRDKIDASADNKKERARKKLARKLDDADSIKDERKKSAKKSFRKAQDDADADRDAKLKRNGLKESKRLNESIYSEVQEFLKDATKYFKDTEEGCYYTPVTDDLYLVAGYPSDEDKPYVKIAFNDSSLQSDYEWDWNMPTYSDGEVAFVEISLRDNDLERDAKYLVREAQSMQKEIDKGNLLLESCNTKKSRKSLKESDKPAATSIEDAQKWVDYDMKKYGKISERTNRLVKKAGFQILKDDHGDYEVAAGKFESCNEDFEKVEIETDREKMSMTAEPNGKVTITTEPKEEIKEEENVEVIEPVSAEVKAEFKSEEEPEEDEFQDVDIDEFDEEEFDTLGEQYLRRVYENVKSFKTTSGSIKGNNLKLEGLITFKSGKEAKTNFVFESNTITKTGKMKFIGENKQFAKGKKAFTLTGKMDGKKLVAESLTYSYKAKDGKTGDTKRLYGRVVR